MSLLDAADKHFAWMKAQGFDPTTTAIVLRYHPKTGPCVAFFFTDPKRWKNDPGFSAADLRPPVLTDHRDAK